jgi:hypothetical protein
MRFIEKDAFIKEQRAKKTKKKISSHFPYIQKPEIPVTKERLFITY